MFLEDLTRDEMHHFEAVGKIRSFAPEDLIVRENQPGSSFFMVITGKVEIRKSVGSATYRKLAELGPCSIFGEVCFLGVESRSASVVALQPCKLLEFHRPDFEQFIQTHPVIGLKVYRGLARELADRLVRNNDELRKAILWAMDEMRDRNQLFLSNKSLAALTSGASSEAAAIMEDAVHSARDKKRPT
jgi:CRP-like cAMP-binding protein